MRQLISVMLLIFSFTALASGQVQSGRPHALEDVGIEQRLNGDVPLSLEFRDERGQTVTLGDYFRDRPVIVSLTYSDCPMLCHLQLDGLVNTLIDMDLEPATDFEIVNVSINPAESPERALITKRKHLEIYGRGHTTDGWHFLVGEEKNIRTLAEAVGFRYKFVPDRNEYAHAAAIMIATPEGKLSRYLTGVVYQPTTLRLSLVEASEGKIGSAIDQVMLFCFQYDAESGNYAPIAMRIMQIGCSLTLLALAIGIVPYWWRSQSRKSEGSMSTTVSVGT